MIKNNQNIFKIPNPLSLRSRSVTNVSDNRCGGVKLVPFKHDETKYIIDVPEKKKKKKKTIPNSVCRRCR